VKVNAASGGPTAPETVRELVRDQAAAYRRGIGITDIAGLCRVFGVPPAASDAGHLGSGLSGHGEMKKFWHDPSRWQPVCYQLPRRPRVCRYADLTCSFRRAWGRARRYMRGD